MSLYTGDFATAITAAGFVQANWIEILVPIANSPSNKLSYSEQLDNAAWTKTNVTVTADSAGTPYSGARADTLSRTSTSAAYVYQDVTKPASAQAWTLSVYAKPGAGDHVALRIEDGAGNLADACFNVATGAISVAASVSGTFSSASATIEAVESSGWYRITLTATTNSAALIRATLSTSTVAQAVDGTGSGSGATCYLWGTQLEHASSASAYLLTENAVAPVRLQDGSAADIGFSSRWFRSRDDVFGVLGGPPGGIEDGEGDVAPSLDFAILPPNATAASTLMQAANQGAAVTLWWGVVDPATGLVIGTPDTQFIGEFDVPALTAGRNSYRVDIQATGVTDRLLDPDAGVGLNHATQNNIWSEDGLEFVTDVNVNLPWGQDSARANLITDSGSIGNGPLGPGGLGNGFTGIHQLAWF